MPIFLLVTCIYNQFSSNGPLLHLSYSKEKSPYCISHSNQLQKTHNYEYQTSYNSSGVRLVSWGVILKGEERELILKGAIDVARSPARRRDENEADTSMLHGRGRWSPGAAILHCILKDYIALLIHAVKRPYEETPVLDSDQHSAVYQFLHECHRARLRCLGFFWGSNIWTVHRSCWSEQSQLK